MASIYAIYSQRRAENKLQRISFLLPELARISPQLREPKFSKTDPRPPEEEVVKYYQAVRDICFHNEHILRSIGLGRELDVIIKGNEGLMEAVAELFKGFDVAFQELLGTEGIPNLALAADS